MRHATRLAIASGNVQRRFILSLGPGPGPGWIGPTPVDRQTNRMLVGPSAVCGLVYRTRALALSIRSSIITPPRENASAAASGCAPCRTRYLIAVVPASSSANPARPANPRHHQGRMLRTHPGFTKQTRRAYPVEKRKEGREGSGTLQTRKRGGIQLMSAGATEKEETSHKNKT